jgi:tryptophan-rich sensory protein
MRNANLRKSLTGRQDVLALAGFVLLCLVVSGLGGLATATGVDGWYRTLVKPGFNPPDWIFAPVWTVLYLMMAVAAWRVWRTAATVDRRRALAAFGVQLGLNLLWSILFFGFGQIGLAFFEILLLLSAIAVCVVLFWRVERLAGQLLVPYLFWVAFAATLNLSLWLLN